MQRIPETLNKALVAQLKTIVGLWPDFSDHVGFKERMHQLRNHLAPDFMESAIALAPQGFKAVKVIAVTENEARMHFEDLNGQRYSVVLNNCRDGCWLLQSIDAECPICFGTGTCDEIRCSLCGGTGFGVS